MIGHFTTDTIAIQTFHTIVPRVNSKLLNYGLTACNTDMRFLPNMNNIALLPGVRQYFKDSSFITSASCIAVTNCL